jgi:hypothetical protein
MTIPIRSLVGATVAALMGTVSLNAGYLLRDLAQAEQEVAAQQFDRADDTFARAERYFEQMSRIPGVSGAWINDIRTRRATLRYWQGEYAALAPEGDPVAAVPVENVGLQMVVANSLFRARHAEAKDREAMLAALNTGMGGYLTVLKNSPRREDAAFNYEYLQRLRDEVEKARGKAPLPVLEQDGPLGRRGGDDTPPGRKTDFKTLVPLEVQEIDKANAGKGLKIQKKG